GDFCWSVGACVVDDDRLDAGGERAQGLRQAVGAVVGDDHHAHSRLVRHRARIPQTTAPFDTSAAVSAATMSPPQVPGSSGGDGKPHGCLVTAHVEGAPPSALAKFLKNSSASFLAVLSMRRLPSWAILPPIWASTS